MSIATLLAGYRGGSLDPAEVVERAYECARSAAGPAWISLAPWRDVKAWLAQLRTASPELPLYGVPFAIKDNIDLAGTPTTAACPAFAYTPDVSAFAVARLIAAGAIPIGKTNMDQFATGLTGTRTPYGACASVADPRYVSGGSSSGSAVVVADGTVPFALATDTAGSGRVPAAFNGIVGFKPTIGRIGTSGVVPACRGLDCVSVLTADVADAARVLAAAGGPDPGDPYARASPRTDAGGSPRERPLGAAVGARIAVARRDQLSFCGDDQAAGAWERALQHATALGWELVEIDIAPLTEAASLLYDGPWVAARYAAVGSFIAAHAHDVDPIVRDVILAGRDTAAVDAFRAAHRVRELALQSAGIWERADALLLPTAPTLYTAAEIADQPLARNALLGTYTNFVNLLDLCAIALPAAARADGLPFGVSLIAPAGADGALLALGGRWRDEPADDADEDQRGGTVALAVVGAHLSGEPLNNELVALGARLVRTTRTAPTYRLYELPGSVPAKPGLVNGDPTAGPGIEVEIWELATEAFGRLVAAIPAPLSIGTLALRDGRSVKGFLCEASAVVGAREITEHGGWRAFLQSLAARSATH
ncbi:MAG: allophanate hydrolase [Solirubrobacteraceae bacterium]|nr:allophanate hydrolase [Solirubrobacteraceae bacterium]